MSMAQLMTGLRCKHILSIVVVVTVLLQCLPFATLDLKSNCRDNGQLVPLHAVALRRSVGYLSPWCVLACLACMVVHPEQHPSQCLVGLVIAGFGASWVDVACFVKDCSSDSTVSRAFDVLHYSLEVCAVGMWILQSYLSLLRLRVLGPEVPLLTFLGEIFFRALIVCWFIGGITLCMHLVWSYDFSDNLVLVAVLSLSMIWSLFNTCIVLALHAGAKAASKEAVQLDIDESCARRMARAAIHTAWTIRLTVCCALTSLVVMWSITNFHFLSDPMQAPSDLILGLVFFADILSNLGSALLLSGFFGGDHRVRPSSDLKLLATSVACQRRRQIELQLSAARGASTGCALTFSSLMEGVSAETILANASSRFRCISWEVLRQHPWIITDARPLDGTTSTNELFHLSEPCTLGECDMFFSHSWHDDFELKWKALESWCEDFTWKKGRSPRLWLDKVCVDQANVEQDLQCLPVFMAGCDTLLVSCGLTYTRRLWCAVELLVFKVMSGGHRVPTVWLMGKTDEERDMARDAWRQFDVANCECFNPEDKSRFLKVVALYPDGADGFNRFIRGFADDLYAPTFETISI
eukprot:TRINITY_DN6207_c0_g1_i11.p1 TRINITY_DN6207_c0_g1~~TRINITY_DN6207_c0_g1_i11.p1  ORF type:complete len:581 (-),score=42.35 TRINITY_DN6207_c0_g1_i11:37-1779(-)